MKTIFVKELKMNLKQLIIWSVSVGLMGLFCILLYQSMEGEMKDMADMFSNMGAFSDAFGMSTLSIASLKGYFATEVGTVHSLGGGMFAAIVAIGIIAKEEDRHSGEFLLSLPVSRTKVVVAKGLCVIIMLCAFTVICALFYMTGFAVLGEEIPYGELLRFMASQLLMNLEIGSICFLISALSSRINMGLGLAVALILYVFDLIGRVVPDLKDYLFMGPYSFANASEIFAGESVLYSGIGVACAVIVIFVLIAIISYNKKDMAS